MEAFIGTILPWPINYAPINWLACAGQILQANQNQGLFALINNIYGGDGRTTFALPDLRNRVMLGSITMASGGPVAGPNAKWGTTGGAFAPTLNVTSQGSIVVQTSNMPPHSHNAAFTPIMGNVPVTVSAPTATIPVTIPVGATVPASNNPASLSGNVYLTNTGATGTTGIKGPFQSAAASGATLVGGTASGNPGGSFTGSVSTTTGGNVAISTTGGGTPVPVSTTGTAGPLPLPPYLAMGFIIATLGLWPERP